ncbi:MAG TPA: ABC transporter permease [Pirellulaceae bacterium]|nr:ABC transporter permease [Pirellulaceae bacterium]
MNLAIKDIRHNLGRFALTTVGVGLLLMVVMGMGGIYRGVIEDAVLLIDRVDADLWIVQRGTRGPFAEVSRVNQNLVHRAQAVPGVATAREFVYHTIQRERDGQPLRIAVMGLDWPNDKGGWLPLSAGRALENNHFEMVADESLRLPLGHRIKLGKETYTVVGLTRNFISSNGDGMAFVTVADALAIQFDVPGEATRLERAARESRAETFEAVLQSPTMIDNAQRPAIARPQVGAVMVQLQPGVAPNEVAKIVEGWGDVTVYTADGQRELLLKGTVDKIKRQIGLFRILLTIIAAIIMALILYTLTLDKIHSIALLKLIGAPNTVILGMILQQALLLGGIGFGIAYVLGQRIFPMFPRRVLITDEDVLQLGLVVLGISVAASLLGIWKAMKVSPNEALS